TMVCVASADILSPIVAEVGESSAAQGGTEEAFPYQSYNDGFAKEQGQRQVGPICANRTYWMIQAFQVDLARLPSPNPFIAPIALFNELLHCRRGPSRKHFRHLPSHSQHALQRIDGNRQVRQKVGMSALIAIVRLTWRRLQIARDWL